MLKNQIRIMFIFAIVAILGIFIIQNAGNTASLTFFFLKFEKIPVILLIFLAMLAGSAIMLFGRILDGIKAWQDAAPGKRRMLNDRENSRENIGQKR